MTILIKDFDSFGSCSAIRTINIVCLFSII